MTTGPQRPSITERRREEWILWRRGFGVSVGLHLLVLLLFLVLRVEVPLESPFAAAGERTGDPVAASGGGMEAVTLSIAEPQPIPRPPPPVFSPDAVVVEDLVMDPMQEMSDLSGLLATTGGTAGMGPPAPGLETGTGTGDGGNAAEGRFRIVPPSPRGMIIPPTNRSLRGRQIEVWVWVDEGGRVVADSTQLRPPTPDGAFNRRLIDEAARWVFEPARQGGVPIAAWFPYTVSM